MNFYNLKLSSSTPASKTEADSGPIHFRPKADSFWREYPGGKRLKILENGPSDSVRVRDYGTHPE